MVCQYVVKYYEISVVVEGFCYIVWYGVIVVVDDLVVKVVCCIGIFNYGGELWIVDFGFNVGGVDGFWVDVNFDDIGVGEDQFFVYFIGDYVFGDDSFLWSGFVCFCYELYKVFGVVVGDVDIYKIQLWVLREDLLGFFEICIGCVGGNYYMFEYVCGCVLGKCQLFFSGVVFMYCGQNIKSGQCFSYVEGVDGIYVSCNNWYVGSGQV